MNSMGFYPESVNAQFTTSPSQAQHTPLGALGSINWPPIICPNCWAMRFFANDYMGQCYYCGRIIMRWRTYGRSSYSDR
jgi:hypothetical protein